CGRNVGVAPEAELVNLIMIPHGQGKISDFLTALDWVAQNPSYQIVNMSAGLFGFETQFKDVLEYYRQSGVLLVAAIGNEGRNSTRSPGNHPNLLSVGASTKRGRVANFS